jgi:hypothetical protein
MLTPTGRLVDLQDTFGVMLGQQDLEAHADLGEDLPTTRTA